MVKLTPALDNLITGQKTEDHPPPIVIDGELEWEVEEILDSRWHRKRFQYLIKWKGYYHKCSLTICDGCFDTLKSSKMRS